MNKKKKKKQEQQEEERERERERERRNLRAFNRIRFGELRAVDQKLLWHSLPIIALIKA